MEFKAIKRKRIKKKKMLVFGMYFLLMVFLNILVIWLRYFIKLAFFFKGILRKKKYNIL